MIRRPFRRLTSVTARIPSDQDGKIETAYRELLELRERVRKAELAALKSVKSNGGKPGRQH